MTPLPKDALSLHKAGQNTEAEARCRELLRSEPQHDGALRLLGIIAHTEQRHEEAIRYFTDALAIAPNVAGAYSNLAACYQQLRDFTASRDALLQAAALDSDNPQILYNLAISQGLLGETDACAASLKRALTLKPDFFKALFTLANLAQDHGWYDIARECYAKARALQPDNKELLYNQSLQLLRDGNFTEGLAGYEERWDHRQHFLDHPRPEMVRHRPQWDGSPMPGKRILIYTEQGLGDAIQFARYLPLVKQRGLHILFSYSADNLYALLRQCDAVDEWVAPGTEVPSFDVHAPLMSLPYIFGTTLDIIPATVPYLHAEEARIEAWRPYFTTQKKKVGVVWAGFKDHDNDMHRSIALDAFSTLFTAKNCHFYSLQLGRDEAAIADLAARRDNLTVLGPKIRDFADTAAILHHLDLFIGVDTSVVHLAGAMARPTITLLPFVPDWRWMMGREDSPWYPTMRLLRQPGMWQWDVVLEQLKTELEQL